MLIGELSIFEASTWFIISVILAIASFLLIHKEKPRIKSEE